MLLHVARYSKARPLDSDVMASLKIVDDFSQATILVAGKPLLSQYFGMVVVAAKVSQPCRCSADITRQDR
jgi:hypothetical protein